MYTPRCSASRIRTALFTLSAVLLASSGAFAQNITVTGIADTGNGASNTLFITSDAGFYGLDGKNFPNNEVGLFECRSGENNCKPGTTQSIYSGNYDLTTHPVYNGVTYTAGGTSSTAGFVWNFSGSFVFPPLAPTATVTTRFTFSGTFNTGTGTTLNLSGAGNATILMHQSTVANNWIVDRITEWFDSTVPPPWVGVDIGATGLYGSSAYNASDGTWNVAGAGADIWGTADSFRYVFPFPAGTNELVARVDSEENTSPFAKAGIMFRQGLSADSRDVLLDVVPDGGIEFMTRTQDGASTSFLGTAHMTFPVWLKLSLDQGITASVSEDGQSWQMIGVTSNPFSFNQQVGGLIVTSHTTQALNHAVISNVSATTRPNQLPTPWLDTDIGAVGLSGSASYDPTNGGFSVTGSGADIWGTADAFNYMYTTLGGDGSVSTEVQSEQNTSPFAKAGLAMRATTDPSSANVILDCLPDGTIEFMARATAGGSTTFIASAPSASLPRSLVLDRHGATVTGYVYVSGTLVRVGSVTVPDFAAGGVLAGLAVTSHDTSVTNTATFLGASVTPSSLPPGWSAQDIGSTGVAGSSSYDPSTQVFTIKGAGADIWGTVDAFQFAYQSRQNNPVTIQARVLSEDGSNPFAKAGVMFRSGTGDSAAFATLDMVPSGSIEFMARSDTGAPGSDSVQYIGGASPGFGAILRLQVSGLTVTGSFSTDGGSTWTTIGSATVRTTSIDLLGLISCSHDPSALNTAAFDTVSIQ